MFYYLELTVCLYLEQITFIVQSLHKPGNSKDETGFSCMYVCVLIELNQKHLKHLSKSDVLKLGAPALLV